MRYHLITNPAKPLLSGLLTLAGKCLSNLLTSLILLVLLSCASGRTGSQFELNPLLPEWFWDMPQESGIRLAVGYSPAYKETPHAFNNAFLDAAMRLWIDKESRLICNKGMLSTRYGLRNIENEDIVLKDTSGFARFCKTLSRLDSISAPDQRIMLVATGPCSVGKDRIRCPKNQPDTPADNYIWGCGVAPRYHHVSNTWIEAEGQARIQMGLAFADVGGLTKTRLTDTGRMDIYASHEVYRLSSDVHLSDVSTIRRRIDVESRTLQVWARGKVRKVQ